MPNQKVNNTLNKRSKGLTKKANEDLLWDFWGPLLLTISLYTGVRSYVAEARYIPSGSMLPGLQIGDRLLIEKITFRRRPPRRGEIVVFNSPDSFDKQLIANRSKPLPSSLHCAFVTFPWISWIPGLGDSACDAYIKRVVGVAGDRVSVNTKGEVSVNGRFIKEPFVSNYCQSDLNGFGCRPLKVLVPLSHVLVLGDNRRNSLDSRVWPGGPFLPEEEIIGKAAWRFWPMKRVGLLKP